jgi:glycosyltransferase involved in cell wall biosynthesis
MNVALITTVFNEEDSIEKFLDSIVNQTQKPFELVIVDAGSKDKTVAIIKNYSKKLPLKLFIHKGNRSVGRNFAIKNATSNTMAMSLRNSQIH